MTGPGYFTEPKAADALQGRGTATADYDRDCYLDLCVVNSNGPFRLYQTGGLSNAWLRLKPLLRTSTLRNRIATISRRPTRALESRAWNQSWAKLRRMMMRTRAMTPTITEIAMRMGVGSMEKQRQWVGGTRLIPSRPNAGTRIEACAPLTVANSDRRDRRATGGE